MNESYIQHTTDNCDRVIAMDIWTYFSNKCNDNFTIFSYTENDFEFMILSYHLIIFLYLRVICMLNDKILEICYA